MSDKAPMLRQTVEAFADLRTMFDGLTEEQASRVWLGGLGARDALIHIHDATPRSGGDQASAAAESPHTARSSWAPGSFWGLRYPSERERRGRVPGVSQKRFQVGRPKSERSRQENVACATW